MTLSKVESNVHNVAVFLYLVAQVRYSFKTHLVVVTLGYCAYSMNSLQKLLCIQTQFISVVFKGICFVYAFEKY